MNKTIHTGRLVSDPKQSTSANGNVFVLLNLAVQRNVKKKDDSTSETADYVLYIVYNKLAEACKKHLVKGQQVEIEGHVRSGKFNDKFYTSFVADRIVFGSKPRSSNTDSVEAHISDIKESIPGQEVTDVDIPEDLALHIEAEELDEEVPF